MVGMHSIFLFLFALSPCAPSVVVELFSEYSQVDGVAKEGKSTSTIAYLGSFPSVQGCQDACLSSPQRCWSFTYYSPVDAKLPSNCFSITEQRWSPRPNVTAAITGRVEWPCRTDSDCSHNGQCMTPGGTCTCRRAWRGRLCSELALSPTSPSAGTRQMDSGAATSTWGGSVLPCNAASADYCLVASEITQHCGIEAWSQNSRVTLSRSSTPLGTYNRTEVLWPVFAHEPIVVRGDKGEYVAYYTAQVRAPTCTCSNGSTTPGACHGIAPLGNKDPSWMSFSEGPNLEGPWSPGMQLFPGYVGADTNFAPYIFGNGSLLGMWRKWTGSGSRVFLATATHWRNLSSYVQHHDELFPDLGTAGTEDMFLYMDAQGIFHAVFHHMYGLDTDTAWWLLAAGGHAFSEDGWRWTYTGVAWGSTTAQGYDCNFTDGTSYHYTRLERPYLVLGEDGDPTLLVNAAQFGTSTRATGQDGGDSSYTLIQPVGLGGPGAV